MHSLRTRKEYKNLFSIESRKNKDIPTKENLVKLITDSTGNLLITLLILPLQRARTRMRVGKRE